MNFFLEKKKPYIIFLGNQKTVLKPVDGPVLVDIDHIFKATGHQIEDFRLITVFLVKKVHIVNGEIHDGDIGFEIFEFLDQTKVLVLQINFENHDTGVPFFIDGKAKGQLVTSLLFFRQMTFGKSQFDHQI